MLGVAFIIPCYNEENTIKEVINRINEKVNIEKEIIVVDDFSSDKTRTFLQNDLKGKVDNVILNDQNYGKGYSIKQGLKVITGEMVIIQDADLEYDPIDYIRLTKPITSNIADVVYGSRFVGSEEN